MKKAKLATGLGLNLVVVVVALTGRHWRRQDPLDRLAAQLPPDTIVVLRSGLDLTSYDIYRAGLESSSLDVEGMFATVRQGTLSHQAWQKLADSLPKDLVDKRESLATDPSTGPELNYEERPWTIMLRSEKRTFGIAIHPHHIRKEKTFDTFLDLRSQNRKSMLLLPEGQFGVMFSPFDKKAAEDALKPPPPEVSGLMKNDVIPYLWYPIVKNPGYPKSSLVLHETPNGVMRVESFQVQYTPWFEFLQKQNN